VRRLAGESESTSAPYDGVMSFEGRDLPEELQRFLSDFITAFHEVSEVWLLGSRADGTGDPGSDWDLLVFADDRLAAESGKVSASFNDARFPLFIAHGDDFIRPWPRKDGLLERGLFSQWK
jgi:predicted nucleotidyltransferase